MDNLTFGERLREMREFRGMTQKELSEKSGVFQIAISKYERGDNAPTITTLEWLVKALDTTATELLGF